MMQRVNRVAEQLARLLAPQSLASSLLCVEKLAKGHSDMVQLVFPQAVWHLSSKRLKVYPQDFPIVWETLGRLTQFYTAEFAVRLFLRAYPLETWRQLLIWRDAENPHLRRLASEASRPRLPWAENCVWTHGSPERSLEILAPLKADPSRYVQKSVANHLNDVWTINRGRHRPWVMRLLADWLAPLSNLSPQAKKAHPTYWIAKHALRNALKQGDLEAFKLLGYASLAEKEGLQVQVSVNAKRIDLRNPLNVAFRIAASQPLEKIRCQWVLWDEPGQTAVKIWQMGEWEVEQTAFAMERTLVLQRGQNKTIKPGTYVMGLQINGQTFYQTAVEVIEASH